MMRTDTKVDLFSYTDDYRDYLNAQVKEKGRVKKGMRSAMAKAAQCQGAYISQVLSGKAHLNLEQAERLNIFFAHNDQESHYFLLLLQKTRAGTKTLKAYFQQQLGDIQEKRLILKERFQTENALSDLDQSIYYSSWIYGAVRVCLTVPELQTATAIANRLQISMKQTKAILEFLVLRNLAKQDQNRFLPTTTRMHLGTDSIMLKKHHTNWRMRAIQSLDTDRTDDLHYSSVISISKDDFHELKKRLVDFLEEFRGRIKDSKEEEVYSLCFDLFQL